MDYVAIGRRIQHMRKAKQLTQNELSEKANISLSFLGHIERGTRVMSLETLVRLSQALGFSTDHLLGIAFVPKSTYEQALEHIRSWIQSELSLLENNPENI